MTDEYMEANRRHWDEVVGIHVASDFYDVASFQSGRSKLKPLELAEVGDVRGKTLLHLQCHFGMDTLSWARDEGAIVTGADFSQNAIDQARRHAVELGIDARFVHSNIYDLPANLDGQFDVVFTSYGVLGWLPDVERWAHVAAHFVRPGGTFYIAEFHPIANIFDDAPGVDDLHVRYPYFARPAPLRDDSGTDYADPTAPLDHATTYWFPHSLADVVTALIDAGLRIDHLHEFPFSIAQFLPFTQELPDGTVRLKKHDGSVPLIYSIKATMPA
jgi:ubiquinone/menaquinone biosynthesis C-methylase UbiE